MFYQVAAVAVVLLQCATAQRPNPQAISQELRRGFMLESQRKYDQAEQIYLAAIAHAEALDPPDPVLATALNYAADLYRLKRRYDQARPLYERSLKVESANGADSRVAATVLGKLCECSRAAADKDSAKSLCTRALRIWDLTGPPNDPGLAIALNNMAALRLDDGDTARAEPLLRKALAIRESPGVLNNLAYIYTKERQYVRAERAYRRAVELLGTGREPEHGEVAAVRTNLGFVYLFEKKPVEAEAAFHQALAEAGTGPEADASASVLPLIGLAQVARMRGLRSDAEELLERANATALRAGGATPEQALAFQAACSEIAGKKSRKCGGLMTAARLP